LRNITSDLFVVEHPLRFLGIEVGARMTIARLSNGKLLLHSPTRLTEETRRYIDSLGDVQYIVAPNSMHHLFVGDYLKAYPNAKSYAAPGLEKKRADVPFSGIFSEEPISDEIQHIVMPRIPLLHHEVVLLLPQHKTLICTDLLFNIRSAKGLSRFLLFFIGGYGRPEPTLEIRLFIRLLARAQTKVAMEKILSWDFDRLVMAHGDVIETNAKQALRDAYRWLIG
jgi:hypothetical protein